MIVNKYYKVIRVLKDGGDGPTPFYIENTTASKKYLTTGSTSTSYNKRNLFYKVDNGEWFEFPDDGSFIPLEAGSRIYLMGDNPNPLNNTIGTRFILKSSTSSSSYVYGFKVGGYLTSLLSTTKFDEVDTIPDYAFYKLFGNDEGSATGGNSENLDKSYGYDLTDLITDNIKYVGKYGCYNMLCNSGYIKSFPEYFFDNVISIGDYGFNAAFYGPFGEVYSDTIMPKRMFTNLEYVGNRGCYKLFTNAKFDSLPDGMFSSVTSVGDNSFNNCFGYCKYLTMLPEGMFNGVTSVVSSTFNGCFASCISLTTLPEGMFSGVTSISSGSSFQSCFTNCTSLTALPEGMFSGVTSVSSGSFQGCFWKCTSLSTLPEGMFANVTTVNSSSFKQCFTNCTSLLIGPNFKKITGSTSHDAFDECFKDCTNLQLIYAPQMSAWNESYFQDWVSGVYPTGKMYIRSGVVPPTGTSGVPEGWQLVNY